MTGRGVKSHVSHHFACGRCGPVIIMCLWSPDTGCSKVVEFSKLPDACPTSPLATQSVRKWPKRHSRPLQRTKVVERRNTASNYWGKACFPRFLTRILLSPILPMAKAFIFPHTARSSSFHSRFASEQLQRLRCPYKTVFRPMTAAAVLNIQLQRTTSPLLPHKQRLCCISAKDPSLLVVVLSARLLLQRPKKLL